MKAKKIMGGLLAAAVVLTSVPLVSTGGVTAMAEGTGSGAATYEKLTVSNAVADLYEVNKGTNDPEQTPAKAIDGEKMSNRGKWQTNWGQMNGEGTPGLLGEIKHEQATSNGSTGYFEFNQQNTFTMTLQEPSTVSYIDYYGRTDNNINGLIRTWKVEVSSDGTTWTEATGKYLDENGNAYNDGYWPDKKGTSPVGLRYKFDADQTNVKQIKLTILSTWTKNSYGTIVATEFEVYGSVGSTVEGLSITIADAVGGKVTSNGSDFTTGKFEYGTEAILTAVPNEGYDFSYWLDADTKKIISRNESLRLLVLNTRNLTPVFTTQNSSEYTATFVLPDLFANKLIAKINAVNGEVDVPQNVELVNGYELIGWVGSDGKTYGKDVVKVPVSANTIFEAKCNATATGLWCTVYGGGHFEGSDKAARNDCKFDEKLKLIAPEVESGTNKKFAGWKVSYDGIKYFLVSTNTNLTWIVKSPYVILNATYEEATSVPEVAAPTVALGIGERTKFTEDSNIEKHKIRLQVLYDGVENTTVVEKGILLTWEENSKDNLSLETDDSNVKRFYSSGTAQTGSYILNATLGANTSANKNVHYKGYVTFRNSAGELSTVYTDLASLAPGDAK